MKLAASQQDPSTQNDSTTDAKLLNYLDAARSFSQPKHPYWAGWGLAFVKRVQFLWNSCTNPWCRSALSHCIRDPLTAPFSAQVALSPMLTSILLQRVLSMVNWWKSLDRYLGPLFHSGRYTSYGRHFTRPSILQKVVHQLLDFITDGDLIVDFSCGENTFIREVKKQCKGLRVSVDGASLGQHSCLAQSILWRMVSVYETQILRSLIY